MSDDFKCTVHICIGRGYRNGVYCDLDLADLHFPDNSTADLSWYCNQPYDPIDPDAEVLCTLCVAAIPPLVLLNAAEL